MKTLKTFKKAEIILKEKVIFREHFVEFILDNCEADTMDFDADALLTIPEAKELIVLLQETIDEIENNK